MHYLFNVATPCFLLVCLVWMILGDKSIQSLWAFLQVLYTRRREGFAWREVAPFFLALIFVAMVKGHRLFT